MQMCSDPALCTVPSERDTQEDVSVVSLRVTARWLERPGVLRGAWRDFPSPHHTQGRERTGVLEVGPRTVAD